MKDEDEEGVGKKVERRRKGGIVGVKTQRKG